MQRSVSTEDALAVIAAALALHDAPDLPAFRSAAVRLVADLIPCDRIGLLEEATVEPVAHRLSIPVPDSGGALEGLVLTRHLRAFDVRDQTVARLMGPLIGAAADHVRLRVQHTGGEGRLPDLTSRERQVLSLVADGRSSRDIADALFIERRTVEKHVEHIKAKLGARSRAEAAAAWARAVVLAS